MSQLEDLIATIEEVKKGMSALDAAQAFLLSQEGKRVKKVAPQTRRHCILRLWHKGYPVDRIARAFRITERHVRRVVSNGPIFGHTLKDFVHDRKL